MPIAGFLAINSSSMARLSSIRTSFSASRACHGDRFDAPFTRSRTSFRVILATG
jgi:hypothetical protein